MAVQTQPLTLGEILDRTIQLFRQNFVLMTAIAAFPAAGTMLMSAAAAIFFNVHNIQFQPSTPLTPDQSLALMSAMGIVALVGAPLMLVNYAMGQGALTLAGYRLQRGESVTVREAYGYAFRRFWRHVGILVLQIVMAWVLPTLAFAVLMGLGFGVIAVLAKSTAGTVFGVLFGIVMFVASVAWIVFSVRLWLQFNLAYPVAVTENIPAWRSLKRSRFLAKGTIGRIFLMYLMVGILVTVVFYAITLPVNAMLGLSIKKTMQGAIPTVLAQCINLLIGFVERALVGPVYAIALVLFYNNQRTQLEGYDIDLLMEQAGWTGKEAVALPLPEIALQPALLADAEPVALAAPVTHEIAAESGLPEILHPPPQENGA